MGLVLAFLTIGLICAVLCGVFEWVAHPGHHHKRPPHHR
jgi:hypothetical protein